MVKRKKIEKNIDDKALPIPMLGKELKRYSGDTFYLAHHEYGVLYHVYNSMDLIIRPSQESAYLSLVDIIENAEEYEKKEGQEKEDFLAYISAVIYVLGIPLVAFANPEFLFDTATSVINFLKESYESSQELKEQDSATIELDESFKNAVLGMEDIQKALKEVDS